MNATAEALKTGLTGLGMLFVAFLALHLLARLAKELGGRMAEKRAGPATPWPRPAKPAAENKLEAPPAKGGAHSVPPTGEVAAAIAAALHMELSARVPGEAAAAIAVALELDNAGTEIVKSSGRTGASQYSWAGAGRAAQQGARYAAQSRFNR